MPGAVNNEDYEIIDVSKGIYAANPYHIPDGYAADLENFVIRDGIIEQRSAFKVASVSVASTGWASANNLGLNPVPINVNCNASFKKLASAWFDPFGSANNRLVGIPTGPFEVSKSPVLANLYVGGLVVYNSTVYASAAAGIIRLNVSNWPTAVGETVVPSTVGILCSRMITHKSRLFGVALGTNRLRFTDAPTVGNLPETWNIATNFIDVNGVGATAIWEIVSLNNYVYIFTDAGLFSLYTSGAPANWVLRAVNPEVVVRNQYSVVQRGSLIYYLTDDGIFATDGFDFRKISQNLSEYFSGSIQPITQEASLQPFDAGLLLLVNERNNTAFGLEGTEKTLFYTKVDNVAWTRFTIPESANQAGDLEYAWGAEVYSDDSKDYESNLIIKYKNAGSGKTLTTFLFQYSGGLEKYNKDLTPNCGASDFTGSSISQNMYLKFRTKALLGSNFMRLKSFKDGVLLIGGRLPFTIEVTSYFNGAQPDNSSIPNKAILNTNTPTTGNTLVNWLVTPIKFGFTQELASAQLEFRFTLLFDSPSAWIGQQDRYKLSVVALGIVTVLNRTMPIAQAERTF